MRKGTKVKNSGKGKRWKRGDSCVTNPSVKKHRDVVRRSFIHGRKGKSGLTVAALEKHNEAADDKDDEDDVMFRDGSGSEHSAFSKVSKPFSISGLTDCTNMTFNKVLRMWSSPSEQSRQVCAVLAAVTEVIRARGGSETEVEYFGALMTAAENVPADDKTTAAAIVFLLSLAIKKVPVAVLRSKFSETSKLFSNLLSMANQDGNTAMLKNVLYIFSVLLSNQDSVVWTESSTIQMYHLILSFADTPKAKVRKSAHVAIKSILKLNLANFKHHPAGTSTSKYCIQELEKHGGDNNSSALHILNLLKQIISFFSPECIKKSCETVLKLMTLGSVMTKVSCLDVLHNLFHSAPPEANLPASLNGKIISALYDFQPSMNDVQVAAAWLAAMEAAHSNLSILDEKLCLQSLPRFYSSIMAYMLSDFSDVAERAASTLKACLEKCIIPTKDTISDSSKNENSSSFQTIFRLVEDGLKYKYYTVWHLVLPVIAAFFEAFGKTCPKTLLKCVVSLCDLHESYNFPCIAELEKTVGVAVRHIGPRAVLAAVPLGLDRPDDVCEFPRSWLLPVLAEHVKQTELQFFTSYFLPLAATLREKAQTANKENLLLESKVYDTLQQQVWALLPGFCSGATDITKSFKNIARILGTALSEREDLRAVVLLSLRTLVNTTEDEEASAELSKFCKNFLPILFNLYSQEDEKSQVISPTILETIKILLTIADEKLIATFAGKAHEKLTQDEGNSNSKKTIALMDLLVVMTMYLEENQVEKVYQFASPLLKDGNKAVQKKAYRILEEICMARRDGCSQFVMNHLLEIKELLCSSLSSSAPSSKAPRLRCLSAVVRKLTADQKDFMLGLLPEVILCTKEVGSKARAAALSLLVEMCNILIYLSDKSKEDCIKEYFHKVMAGFGGSAHMISGTLQSLAKLTREYRESMSASLVKGLLNAAIDLLKSKEREVAKSALLFTQKLIPILDAHDLEGHAQGVITALFVGKDERKSLDKYQRQVVLEKLIRKLGYQTVHSMTPIKHRRFVVGIHKLAERSRKSKNERRHTADNGADPSTKSRQSIDDLLEYSDSDEDDIKEKPNKPSKSKSWIVEENEGEAIDLLDPKASKFVVGTQPKTKGKKVGRDQSGFKLSSDGKLIIEDEEEEAVSGNERMVKGPDGSLIPEKIKLGKRKLERDDYNEDDEAEDENMAGPSSAYKPGGKGIHRPILKAKRRKTGGESQVKTGAEYKAKKAKGDIKLKGKPDPFAYIPLDKRKLNKRKTAKLSGQFQGFVRAAKRGASKGKRSKSTAK